MIESKYTDPLENFICHGTKTIGNYLYVLLIDETGQTLIQQVANDQSTILFVRKPNASNIESYWNADITTYSYTYLYLINPS
jgi:hypothetical protein